MAQCRFPQLESERNEVKRAPRVSGAPTALPAGREGRVPLDTQPPPLVTDAQDASPCPRLAPPALAS
jgi:hypothetical protein